MDKIIEKIKTNESTVVDVRSPMEYAGGHVVNSVNIPVNELGFRMEEFKAMKKPIILCCASGARSGMATNILKSNGIAEVYNGGSWLDINSVYNS